MADETLEDFRKRETDLLVRRRYEVAELLYEKALTTGDPRIAKAYLEVTGPMVKETEKADPLAGLPRVEISIHYGSISLGTVTPAEPQPLEVVEEVQSLPAPESEPEAPLVKLDDVIDADTLAKLLED